MVTSVEFSLQESKTKRIKKRIKNEKERSNSLVERWKQQKTKKFILIIIN